MRDISFRFDISLLYNENVHNFQEMEFSDPLFTISIFMDTVDIFLNIRSDGH